jgi:sulfide:quinone oxidoreductase
MCFIEFGHHEIGRVEVTFRPGERPVGRFGAASEIYRADKSTFGSSRAHRWFGRKWSTT